MDPDRKRFAMQSKFDASSELSIQERRHNSQVKIGREVEDVPKGMTDDFTYFSMSWRIP
jgi:hypothetical protein